jgi:methionyl-tRNA formyltransferase
MLAILGTASRVVERQRDSRKSENVRTIFFGSPEFAVPTLEALAASDTFEVVLVVTQGVKEPSPVERAAEQLGLPVYKPETLRGAEARQPLVDAAADIYVVAAFGLIFRAHTLAIPRLGAINVHPSLLPKYRGASPIMATIASGDRETGVSLLLMDAGIDTGPVVSTERIVVEDDDTTESLGRRLAEVAAEQAVRDIPRWIEGELEPMPQENAGASLTRMLQKADGEIDWGRAATEIERQVRAMWPWPRTWTTVDGSLLQVHAARVADEASGGLRPGAVLPMKRRILVATGDGVLELLVVEPAGRRAMSAMAYLNGRRTPLSRLGGDTSSESLPPLIRPL